MIPARRDSKLRYSFFFISLITPAITSSIKLYLNSPYANKKIYLKQSYILLTWFYYLSFVSTNLNAQTIQSKHTKLKVAVLPIKRKTFTLTRAPMAHRNWSKEQYKFQFYKIKISLSASFKNNRALRSLNAGLLFFLLNKDEFPQFESNLLFLKYLSLSAAVSDSAYFNYFKFKHSSR